MKGRIIPVLAACVVAVAVVVAGPAPAAAPKAPPKPPRPLNPDGTPWKPVDYLKALERAHKLPPLVKKVLKEKPSQRRKRLMGHRPTMKDMTHAYLVLDSPLIARSSDLYQPVIFMHKVHAGITKDCLVCHHMRPADPAAKETTACSACHRANFDPNAPTFIGLKAAYHRKCMDCHERSSNPNAPTDCTSCHRKRPVDHSRLVKLPSNPTPTQVTRECLRCHATQGQEMLSSAHWLWRGPSPYTEDHEKDINCGKGTNVINNFCVALISNWPRCTSCHAGYGWKDAKFDFSDPTHIDCLVCHDTTGTYYKAPPAAGMPYPQIDLRKIAQHVGLPSRKNCGDCHFRGGGGDAVKHGDLNSVLYYPSRNCDVHMGGMGMVCIDCHKVRHHRIPGRSLSVPVVEGVVTCEQCHTSAPHQGPGLLNHHLNRHVAHLACTTCHSPVYAKCKPTKLWWDWSKAGDKKRKPRKDRYGMPDYMWKKGEFRWGESVKPTYRWYNGKVARVLLGDKVDLARPVVITQPIGDITDPKAKIYPFKVMRGRQGADAEYRYLLVPHLFGPGGYWKTLNWDKAFRDGMKAAGLAYSGKYIWVDTEMYWALNHEIMPARNALGCAQCHPSLKGEKTCDRCHQDKRNIKFKELAHKGTDFAFMRKRGRDVARLIGVTDYIDFKALGYKGDPILFGGRFKQLPLRSDRSCP